MVGNVNVIYQGILNWVAISIISKSKSFENIFGGNKNIHLFLDLLLYESVDGRWCHSSSSETTDVCEKFHGELYAGFWGIAALTEALVRTTDKTK